MRVRAREDHPEAERYYARNGMDASHLLMIDDRGQPRGALVYSLMSRSGAGGMRGGEGDTTSPPVTVW